MSSQMEIKKTLVKKTQALARLIREYHSYQEECEGYDLQLISQDKKQLEFYQESKGVLEMVTAKLIDFYHQLKCFMQEREEEKKEMEEEWQTANSKLEQVKSSLPALC